MIYLNKSTSSEVQMHSALKIKNILSPVTKCALLLTIQMSNAECEIKINNVMSNFQIFHLLLLTVRCYILSYFLVACIDVLNIKQIWACRISVLNRKDMLTCIINAQSCIFCISHYPQLCSFLSHQMCLVFLNSFTRTQILPSPAVNMNFCWF